MGAFFTNGDLINILFFNFFNLGDIFLFLARNKNISPRLKKLKKSILIKSPFVKKAPKVSPSKSA